MQNLSDKAAIMILTLYFTFQSNIRFIFLSSKLEARVLGMLFGTNTTFLLNIVLATTKEG